MTATRHRSGTALNSMPHPAAEPGRTGFAVRLDDLLTRTLPRQADVLGYPFARDVAIPAELLALAGSSLNNVGDPFDDDADHDGPWHTHAYERDVVRWFAELWGAPTDPWGYVTSGGTAGNRQGLKLGLIALRGHGDVTVYYSTAAHYSVAKVVSELGATAVEVPTQPGGELDYAALAELVTHRPGSPALVVATYGTTMTEARDDPAVIHQILNRAGVEHRYLHVDAALDGSWAPLVGVAPPLSFDGVDSITTSGHKFIGLPEPCGVFVTRREHRDRAARFVSYLGGHDVTEAGSRSGHLPIWFAYLLEHLGHDKIRDRALGCLDLAAYAQAEMSALGWPATRTSDALTVTFPTPPADVRRRWYLSTDADLGVTHLVCVPGVTRTTIDRFLTHLAAQRPPSLPAQRTASPGTSRRPSRPVPLPNGARSARGGRR